MSKSNEELELLEMSELHMRAWKEEDIDTLFDIEKESFGYGRRASDIRTPPKHRENNYRTSLSDFFAGNKGFFNTMSQEDVRIIGDIGLHWGVYTENLPEKDGSINYVKVRFTNTWIKIDGKWKIALYHRERFQ